MTTTPTPRYSATEIAQALGLHVPTAEQRAVIEAPLTSMLVVAGAGSGKTETMSARVVWLVANGLVAPERILGLTFTRKAAGELGERIAGRLRALARAGLWADGEEVDAEHLPTVATYHSYAGGLVREHGLRLGVEPDARLLTEAAAWQYAHEVVVRYDGPMDEVPNVESTVTAAVRDLSGQLAEHLLTPADLDGHLADVERRVAALPAGKARGVPAPVKEMLGHVAAQRRIVPLLEQYSRLKRSSESLDFADQMALAARLADLDPGVATAERARYGVVLLDEFQDTSEAQMRLLHAIFADPAGGVSRPVTAVGDPHQSIYGWRGASATTLAAFPQRFTVQQVSVGERHRVTTEAGDRSIPEGGEGVEVETGAGDGTVDRPVVVPSVLPLSTSWRNDAAVLEVANRTAAPLSAESAVPVQPLAPSPAAGTGRVDAARLLTAQDEADHVAEWIARAWFTIDAAGTRRPAGISAAVLCRRRAQFAAVADALGARGIPVEVVGLGGLLTRAEVSDIVSLLRVVHDPSRGDALMRLLTGPFVRLGAADLDALGAWSRQMPRSAPTDEGTGEQERLGRATDDLDDEPSLVEGIDALPEPGWTGRAGERFSAEAHRRLQRLAETVAAVRSAVGLPLPDLVVLAERALGLDVEVAAALDTLPVTARAHLDAFVDAAAGFAHAADRPTLGGFLDWLDAARDEERGLDSPATSVAQGAVQVLTVHAAKGLEWDVVAVPGLVEAAFPTHRTFGAPKDGGLPRPKSKGWLTGLGSVPYDLRGDVAGLPRLPWQSVANLGELKQSIDDFAEAGGLHLLAEERRLAYVAFTRARHRMLLTASVWLEGTRPRVTSRFLTDLIESGVVTPGHWEPDPEEGAENPSLTDAAALWPQTRDDPRDEADRLAARWVDAALTGPVVLGDDEASVAPEDPELRHLAGLTEVLLAEWNTPREAEIVARLPGHLSTSALVDLNTDAAGFAERLRRPMPTAPPTAARSGTAFHSWIERHYRSASLVDDLDLLGYLDEEAEVTDLDEAKRLFLASPWASATPVEVEVSLETVVAGLPIRGRIDAVFARPDGGVTIVDWKTGAPPSGERLRRRSVQLAVYRLAYARWSGLDPADIDAAFYYAATGRTIYPPLPSEEELVALLAELTAAGS